MTDTSLVKQSISPKRKYIAGFVFVISFMLLVQICRNFYSGKNVEVTRMFVLLAIDALLFSTGAFILIKSKFRALLISLGVLFVLLVPFTFFILFLLFGHDLLPDSENIRRYKALDSDGVLSCPVAGSTFKKGDRSDAFNKPGQRNAFDGGDSPSEVTRTLKLNGADPTRAVATFAKCAQDNGWSVTPATTENSVNGDLGFRGTKKFPDGWTASMDVSATMHQIDHMGYDRGAPSIWFRITTDYVAN